MLFNSLQFLIFFPLVTSIYFVIPQRAKCFWLLAASYFFYMCWNPVYAILLLFSTMVTYAGGLLTERAKPKNKKRVVILSFVLSLLILFYFKYTNFILLTLEYICSLFHVKLHIPTYDIVLPVGISFYTFQALGYIIDVYRKDIYAEKNFFRYALFVSFFPQLVAGPIERSKNLLKQLSEPKKFDFASARDGFFLILWGFFLKIVIADRIALFVNTIYGNYETYGGYFLIVATMLFGIQIYCDFYGYSTIAMGVAQILGIRLMENFNAPYLSISVNEFWRRWHISLTSWFRDYLYIPLGGSRKGYFRKHLNKMIVFLISGLWHGAGYKFLIWGGLNGLYQVTGELLQPVREKLAILLHLHKENLSHKLLQIISTFIFVDFTWIFFRADTLRDALNIIKQMFVIKNPWILFDGALYDCGLDRKNFTFLLICIGILLFSDYCKQKGIQLRILIATQDYWFRWLFIVFAICFILTFGIWGPAYNEADFIYFQF
ncbi:MAG: MBOAT family protein [Roseburia sp.]|nr:MBOAT family protein [Roseburia sp.]